MYPILPVPFRVFLTLLVGLGLFSGALRADPSRADQVLPEKGWRIQAATTPDSRPQPDAWGAPGVKVAGTIDSIWSEQTFTCPAEWADGRRVFLDFERTEGDSIVFLNGQRLAELLAPGGEIEIPKVLFGRENTLTVFTTRAYVGISRTFEQDLLRHAVRAVREQIPTKDWQRGITAPVTLRSRPTQAVTDVSIVTSWREKTLALEIEVNAAVAASDLLLEAVIRDANGKAVLSLKSACFSAPAGRSVQRLSSPWANPIPWELDKPYLYQAEVRLARGGSAVDQLPPETFGFREVWTEGRNLMLNGNSIRLRLTDLYGASANAISFYRLMGYNSGQIQPHAKLWWHVWNDTPLLDEKMLEEADRLGFAIMAPAPAIGGLRTALLENAALRDAYEKEMRRFTRKYRNHPSILAWAVGMNTYNPTSNIHADTLGRREASPPERGRVVQRACEIARAADPTRLVYSHADGSLGDVSTANVYLNFAPLQEREEWPMAWARSGDMPYSAVEFGQPFTANFWKDNQFLMTEYLAMYLGERAYELETDAGIAALIDIGVANKRGFGDWKKVDASLFPGYWEFQDLFVTRTNRAWRTWGVNGGMVHWLLDVGYGNPSAAPQDTSFLSRYKRLPAPVTERPAWANENFEIHAKSNQPFLAYIAGDETHTDRTHSFYAGELFQKRIALIWDGADPKPVTVSWTLAVGETVAARGSKELTLAPWQIAFVPLALTAPQADAVLSMRVVEGGREIATDSFALQVFEKPNVTPVAARVALFDPAEKSGAWLRGLGVKPGVWRAGEALDGVEVLMIGREALKPGDKLPYTAKDIERGLRVLILEQQPGVWEMLGFETIETLPRHTFAADPNGTILAGLKAADLVDWRGSPDLLPEGRQVRTYETQRAPRWTNRHAVASVVLKTPEVVGFTPILKTEFDLAYSPLLEWRHGKGAVYFNSLDLTGRVGVDPAATKLAANLVRALTQPLPATVPVYYRGEAVGETLLGSLHVALQTGAPAPGENALWVLGDELPDGPQVAEFLKNGGTVLRLPQTAKALRAAGFSAEEKALARTARGADTAVLRGVGGELLRWREALAATVFTEGGGMLAGGILRGQTVGKGRQAWLQVSPELLAHRHLDEPAKREAIQLSVARLHRLVAQVLTNLGASPSSALADRACRMGTIATFQPIGSWHVLGPWKSKQKDAKALLAETWPGESDALAGDDNPNTTYRRDDGVSLDWRKVVQADESGFVDLQKELQSGEGLVVYAQRKVSSEKNRMVRVRLGADYWLRFWVNGRLLLDVSEPHAAPKAAAFLVDVPLKAGANVLTVKAVAGAKGFGFWADMGELAGDSTANAGESPEAKAGYYTRPFKAFDPYQFHYW